MNGKLPPNQPAGQSIALNVNELDPIRCQKCGHDDFGFRVKFRRINQFQYPQLCSVPGKDGILSVTETVCMVCDDVVLAVTALLQGVAAPDVKKIDDLNTPDSMEED